ncbi:MAG: SufS family cysteine desulfurase [Betaproteobacteria bacterium]|nr:SufS family cysteine desulfurase [Betaproteobacteria bacterium]
MANEIFSAPPGGEHVSGISRGGPADAHSGVPAEVSSLDPSEIPSGLTSAATASTLKPEVPAGIPFGIPYGIPHSAAAGPAPKTRIPTGMPFRASYHVPHSAASGSSLKPGASPGIPFGAPHHVPHSTPSVPALNIPAFGVDLPYAETLAALPLALTGNSRTRDGGSPFYFLDEALPFGGAARTEQVPEVASARPPFDVNAIRRDFPILKELVNGRPLVWLDNAATTQKPQSVIDRLTHFYRHENSNIHRAAHELAARATDAYEQSREKVRRFLNAPSADEIVFLRGTTEAINLVAQSWGRQNIGEGDEIVITWLEHHANIVPWQQLCSEKRAKLRVAPVDNDGQILLDEYQKLLGSRTKLVSFSQVSNALGTVTPARQMIEMAHRVGARVLVDGAQSVSHMRVDMQQLDCDWFVFSGHKIFGPTGIGALFGKSELLNTSPPWQGGGNMIRNVTFEKTTYQSAPARFEAGTGNIADAAGLGAAIDYVERIGIDNINRYEHDLMAYATQGLNTVDGLRLIGTAPDKAGVLSFALKGFTAEEVGDALNREGIAVRAGHHCAQPILRRFGLESTVRPSLAMYNTRADVDILVAALQRLRGRHYNY